MRNDVKAFGGSIKGMLAGAFTIGSITSLLDHFGRIQDLADRFGASAETMQRVGNAAQLAGTDIETVARALTVLTKSTATAENGSEEMQKTFASMGISLKEFKALSPEKQLIELSHAYTTSSDRAQALNSIMKLLGKSGAEMVPLLVQGPEALRESLENAAAASDKTVARLARIGDEIDKAKQAGIVVGASILQVLDSIGTVGGAVIGTIVSNYLMGFREIAGGAKDVAKAISSALRGDFDGASEAVDSFKGRGGNIVRGIAKNIEEGTKIARQELAEIWDDTQIKGPARNADSDIAAADAAEEAQEKRKQLEKDIAKLEEDAAMARLNTEEKIQALIKQRGALAADSVFLSGNDALTAREKQLEIEKEILALQKQQQEENRAAAEEVASLSRSLADAVQAEAEADKANRRAAMSDEEKIADLKREQAELMRQSRDAEKAGQHLEAIQKRTQAKGIGGEIAAMERANKPVIPTIIAGNLRQMGGGGRAVANVMNPNSGIEQRQDTTNDLLRKIDSSLKRGSQPRRSAFQ